MSDTTTEKDDLKNEDETQTAGDTTATESGGGTVTTQDGGDETQNPSYKHSKAYKAAQRQKAREANKQENLLRRSSRRGLSSEEAAELASRNRSARMQWLTIFALLTGIAIAAIIILSLYTQGTLMGRI